MDHDPHVRFAAFLEWKGWTQADAADALGCSAAFVSMIFRATKLPGRRVANAIERETSEWPDGPIRATEWDVVELRRRDLAATGTEG